MISKAHALAAAAMGMSLFTVSTVWAQQQRTGDRAPQADAARPANPAANLPSDSGSQTTLPSGAVTGAGQPQGRGYQPDVGAPGGLEPRAREAARRESLATDAQPGTGAGSSEAGQGAIGEDAARRERGARPPRQSGR